ncbi:MAG: CGEA protein [Sporolactobacillus sp.]|jgi:spore maturation protein CgeA|nr:CGEA protein [Sporolactobacillus sp.]
MPLYAQYNVLNNHFRQLDKFFRSLPPGTTVTIYGDSGTLYGPAEFVSFDPLTGLVSLLESTGVSPATSQIINIPVRKIESVTTS